MSFLTPILLAGGAAFLIPLLIHLLNRHRVERIPWGAMHLLHEVLKQQKRRMQIEHWLLLMTRIAIPLVLAMTLARPMLAALRQIPGFGKASLVVLTDQSFSMRAPAAAGGSLAEESRTQLGRVMEALPSGADVQMIAMGGVTESLTDGPSTERGQLMSDLADLSAFRGSVSLPTVFQEARAALDNAVQGSRELMIVSDFQRRDWLPLVEGGSVVGLEGFSELPYKRRPVVTLFSMEGIPMDNLAVVAADLSSTLVAATQPLAIKVRVKNFGDQSWPEVPVHLEVNGNRVRSERMVLPPRGEAALRFIHRFDEIGDQGVTVRIDGDSFSGDNAFHTVVQVRDRLPILLLDGTPEAAAMEGATDFLALALAPHAGANARELKDLIDVRVETAVRFKEEKLRGVSVVILAGFQEPVPRLMQVLKRFVDEGGALFLLASELPQVSERKRESEGMDDWLPADVIAEQFVGQDGFPKRVKEEIWAHPALEYFNETRSGQLKGMEVHRWWQLDPHPDSRVLVAFDNGAPWLVERTLGQGRVMMSAVPLRPGWSNVAAQPWFVPLAQKLVVWLAAGGRERSWLAVDERAKFAVATGGDKELILVDPRGRTTPLKVEQEQDQVVVRTPPLTEPGLFAIHAAPTPQQPYGETVRRLAVNVDSEEGDLRRLTRDELRDVALKLGAEIANSFESYQRLDRARRLGVEIWQPLVGLLLILLFLEVFLQQRVTRPSV